MSKKRALVVLSGGQDSTTCAAIARCNCDEVHALTFDYGQRHDIEVESACEVAKSLGLTSHEIVYIDGLLESTSPLISSKPVETYSSADEVPEGIASTFVPCRNALFLTIAVNRAIALDCGVVYTGVCETDYSGYPDCRRDFIDALEHTLSLANYGEMGRVKISTPLMKLTKAQSITLAVDALGEEFTQIMSLTHTC
jgi:7-cyano-7-deazaguanine synthase